VCVPMLYNGTPHPPQKCPFPWGDMDLHLIHGSLGSPESSTQMAPRLVQAFLQGSLVISFCMINSNFVLYIKKIFILKKKSVVTSISKYSYRDTA